MLNYQRVISRVYGFLLTTVAIFTRLQRLNGHVSERLPWFPYGILPIAGAQGCASVSRASWLTIWDPTFWQSVFKRVQSSVCCCIGKATVQCSACTVTLVCFQSWRFGTTLNASPFLCVSNFRNISWFDRSLNCNSFFFKNQSTVDGLVLELSWICQVSCCNPFLIY